MWKVEAGRPVWRGGSPREESHRLVEFDRLAWTEVTEAEEELATMIQLIKGDFEAAARQILKAAFERGEIEYMFKSAVEKQADKQG